MRSTRVQACGLTDSDSSAVFFDKERLEIFMIKRKVFEIGPTQSLED